MSVFNDRLRDLRDNSGISSKELAKKLDISESKLSYYMSGDREPSYELLIAIANEFSVTTDYLVGKSNQKQFDEELLAQSVSAKSNGKTKNDKHQAEIENKSIELYNLLMNFSDVELSDTDTGEVWEIVSLWLQALSSYFNLVAKHKTPEDILDEARAAMESFSKARHLAIDKVSSMLEEIIKDEAVDKTIKDRIFISTSFGIKPSKSNNS